MKVLANKSLKNLNTFKINATTSLYTEVNNVYELTEILSNNEYLDKKILILGGGSNILFTQDFDGLVIKNNIKGFTVVEEDKQFVYLKSGAGELWHDLVLFTIDNNWGGLENLSLIPGTVGAAPIQNIGAYGVELKDTFVYLEALEISTLKPVRIDLSECKFGYRESIFKNEAKDRYYILSVVFKLSKSPTTNTSYGAINEILKQKNIVNPSIKDISEAICEIRRSKLPDPEVIGNAGSFFKNPSVSISKYELLKKEFPTIPSYPIDDSQVKIPAGWLIEQGGWKGKTFENYGVHKNQALVLVNYGNATGQEILNLSINIQKDIEHKFGIKLCQEVNNI